MAPLLSASLPGQPLGNGLKNNWLGFLWFLKRTLPSIVPCSFLSKVGLVWVPGKAKRKSAGLVWGGEQRGTRDCLGLVHGAGNSSLASLAENSSMSQCAYPEDAGEYILGVCVCVCV